jgi:hypothetical protein
MMLGEELEGEGIGGDLGGSREVLFGAVGVC